MRRRRYTFAEYMFVLCLGAIAGILAVHALIAAL